MAVTRALVVLQAFAVSSLAWVLSAAFSAARTGVLNDSTSVPRGTSTIVYSSFVAEKRWYLLAIAGKSQSARPSCTHMIDAPVLRKYLDNTNQDRSK